MVRVPSQVHHREYEHAERFHTVKDAVRKTVDEASPNITFNDRSGFGIIYYVLDGGKDFSGEIIAQAGFVPFIITDSCVEFLFRFGME
jgi:hypothetical protein